MVIEELGLSRFRNYPELFVRFSEKLNLFIGKNGQGKTNLLEAVYLLTHLESFRTAKLSHLIQNGADTAYLKATILRGGIRHKVKLEISGKGRKVWLDDMPVKKISTYISSFYSFIFNAESLHLTRLFTQHRRGLFDRYVSFMDPAYLQEMKDFRVVAAQKNKLLKKGDKTALEPWNHLFAAKSCVMMEKRREVVEKINQSLTFHFQQLTGREEILRLKYLPSLKGPPDLWEDWLNRHAPREAAVGYSLWGPHRDDYRLEMAPPPPTENPSADPEWKPEPLFSQGEYRISMLALQMAMNRMVTEKTGSNPVLVLDDLFAELDTAIQSRLMTHLEKLPNQLFITHTETPVNAKPSAARIRMIQSGKIT